MKAHTARADACMLFKCTQMLITGLFDRENMVYTMDFLSTIQSLLNSTDVANLDDLKTGASGRTASQQSKPMKPKLPLSLVDDDNNGSSLSSSWSDDETTKQIKTQSKNIAAKSAVKPAVKPAAKLIK